MSRECYREQMLGLHNTAGGHPSRPGASLRAVAPNPTGKTAEARPNSSVIASRTAHSAISPPDRGPKVPASAVHPVSGMGGCTVPRGNAWPGGGRACESGLMQPARTVAPRS